MKKVLAVVKFGSVIQVRILFIITGIYIVWW